MLILRHGWHGIKVLKTLLKAERDRVFYETYTANTLGVIANGLLGMVDGGKKYPLYSDMIDGKTTVEPQDTRTAAEIKQDIYSKFSQ